MKRKAVIITGYPNNIYESKHMELFANYYKDFFHSNSGGAFELHEIIQLAQPDSEELKELISEARVEFGIIVLIGHGATKKNNQLFQINESEIIKAGHLNLEFDKKIVILESCRNIVEDDIPTIDLSDQIPSFRDGGTYRKTNDRKRIKNIYVEQIKKCDNGEVICLACNIGEKATNFYFSSSFLQIGHSWSLDYQNHEETLCLNELMFLTQLEVTRLTNRSQNPEMIGDIKFPIVISKY